MIFAAFTYLTNKKGWFFARLITEEGSCLGKSVLGTLPFPQYTFLLIKGIRLSIECDCTYPIPAFFGASYSRE